MFIIDPLVNFKKDFLSIFESQLGVLLLYIMANMANYLRA